MLLTVLTGFLYGNDSSTYVAEVRKFVRWCKGNSLIFITGKTKEVVYELGNAIAVMTLY